MELSSKVRIETATANVFSDYPNGEMWTGFGERKKIAHIDFPGGPFQAAPVVTVAISMFDAGNQANIRISASATDVTASGFTIVVSTWADTKLASVSVTWLAIGH